jgi:hypothetical protein
MKTAFVLRYLLVFFLLAGMGCEKKLLEQTFSIGSVSLFSVNHRYYSSDGRYSLLIKEVSDSRCPEGVVCIWSGEVSLKGEWSDNGIKSDFELHTVMTQLQKQPDGFTLKIVDAIPHPKAGTPSHPENLLITLSIQKN